MDLFQKDFIIIPINEQSHWFLAIICFPSLIGPVTMDGCEANWVKLEGQPIKQACVLIFDSLRDAKESSGLRSRVVVAKLRDYLTSEYQRKVNQNSQHCFNESNLPTCGVKVPHPNKTTVRIVDCICCNIWSTSLG